MRQVRGCWGAVLAVALSLALEAQSPARGASSLEQRITTLLSRMTLEEKFGQLQQLDGEASGAYRPEHIELARKGLLGSTLNVRGAARVNELQRVAVEESRLKIPLIFAFDVIHGYRTIFPIPLGESASWDPAAAERSAAIAAAEARAAGVAWTFAPMVDIARDARWGRIAEGAGEDPFLGAALARARVLGFQGHDYSAPDRVVACAKHWVAYGAAESGRDYNTTDVSERTLRAVYFPPFKAAIDAGVGTFMSAFNDLNGVPASANPWTLRDVLRREWRFDGVVVSDYNSVLELVNHGIAEDAAGAARAALPAGVDVEMVSRAYATHGPDLVRRGVIPIAVVDEAVRRVLRIKLRAGLFDRPYADPDRERATIMKAEYRTAAREIAARSMVLLKNDGQTLPLSADVKRLAVIGPLADDRDSTLGNWTGDGRPDDAVTVLAGLRSALPSAEVTYAKGVTLDAGVLTNPAASRVGRSQRHQRSRRAGTRGRCDCPGDRRDRLDERRSHLPNQPRLAGPAGRPRTRTLRHRQAGRRSADERPAAVDPLAGDRCARDPRSVVSRNGRRERRCRRPAGQGKSRREAAGHVPQDRWPGAALLQPQAHGPSGERRRQIHLKVHRCAVDTAIPVRIRPELHHLPLQRTRGDTHEDFAHRPCHRHRDREQHRRAQGDEVVQLYLHDRVSTVTRPVAELKGFRRLTIAPGGRETVTFALGSDQIGAFNRAMNWVVEPGQFDVRVGPNSAEGPTATFEVRP